MRKTAVLLVLLLAACASSPERLTATESAAVSVPTQFVIIFMENHSASQIIGNSNAPYLNQFAKQGIRFTNYKEGNSNGPSLPDYLQIAAGSSCNKTDDNVSAGNSTISSACPTTLWNQLATKGISWKVYQEAMPAACSSATTYKNTAVGDSYAMKHNPATPFKSIYGNQTLCKANVLPFTAWSPSSLPKVSFISPGICNDMHGMDPSKATFPNCVKDSSANMLRADTWLKSHVPQMLTANATVFITFDESGTLYAAEVGPGIAPGTTDSHAYTHYSVLAALEQAYGLALLGGAKTATPIPL